MRIVSNTSHFSLAAQLLRKEKGRLSILQFTSFLASCVFLVKTGIPVRGEQINKIWNKAILLGIYTCLAIVEGE